MRPFAALVALSLAACAPSADTATDAGEPQKACERDPLSCGVSGACIDVTGGFVCDCPEGFLPAPAHDFCNDVDECRVGNGGCAPEAECINTPGGRECRCPEDFCGDGIGCRPALDCIALAPPERVDVTPGDGSALLRWAPVSGATGYAVARADGPDGRFMRVGETTATAFLDSGLTNGTLYRFVVSSLRSGLEGAPSAEVSVMPTSPPDAPQAPVIAAADTVLHLTWTASQRATGYRVLRRDDSGPATVIATTAETALSDAGRLNARTYRYSLIAFNDVGESAPSSESAAIPLSAPQGLSAVAGDGEVLLFWSPSSGADRYAIERLTGGSGAIAGETTGTRFRDAGRANGVPLTYRIVPHSARGPGRASPSVSATPAPSQTPLPPPEDPGQNALGLNLWFNTDWDGSAAFVDVFKQSRPWQDGANWHAPVGGVDAFGWPTADASTVLYSGPPDRFNGTYRLLFEGSADVSVMWAPGSVSNKQYDPVTNTTSADVTFAMTQSGSVGLVFQQTRRTAASPAGSGFANARLYRPGYPADGSTTFTTPFLEALTGIRVLRTMEWAGGSSHVVVRWADRVTPRHATQGGLPAPPYTAPDGATYTGHLGVAIEHQIALCNTLMVDCWINVPPAADDGYVQNLALALRFGTDGTTPYTSHQAAPVYPPLHPSLRIYVEYSNENWNSGSGFLAFHIIKAICAHLPASHPVMQPPPDSIYTAVWRYPAWRTVGIAQAFRDVFGEAAMMTRIRPVLMTQQGNANDTLASALSWLEGHLMGLPGSPPVSSLLYGAGGSAYYGAVDMLSALPDRFFAAGNFPSPAYVRAFTIDTLWSRNYGLRHVAYEGGPGLSFSSADNRQINADPRMQTMVEQTHDAWSASGGDLLVYYTLHGPPEWEFTPDVRQRRTPKLQALESLAGRARAPLSFGTLLPGPLVARDPAQPHTSQPYVRTGFGYDLTIDGQPCVAGIRTGNFIALPARAETPYAGTLTVHGYAATATRLAVWLNGERQGEVLLSARPGSAALYDSSPLPVTVPTGAVVVRLEVTEGDFVLQSVNL